MTWTPAVPWLPNSTSPQADQDNQDGNRGGLTAPSNFTAVGGDTVANLSWSSVAGATDYEVRIDGGSWISTGNITGYQFQSLTNDQSYTFDVRATNATEDGPISTDTATPSDNENALSGGYTPLTIVSPQVISTTSRFSNAYPGLEYDVAIGVTGGYFPYTYELTAAPSGMTIDLNTGEINWPNAQTVGNSYTVTVLVTDNNGGTVSKTWQLAVTTTNFYFVDSVNGNSANDGSIGSPWKEILDVFGAGSKFTTYIPDGIIYFLNGTYDFVGVQTEETGTEERVPWYVDRKATKWLAYPSHAPEINFNNGGANTYLSLQFDDDDLYFEGLDLNNNANQRGKTITCSPANHWVFRNNNWRGNTVSFAGGNNAYLFYAGGSGQYGHVTGNTSTGAGISYWMLDQSGVTDLLIDRNTLDGSFQLPVGPKEDTNSVTYRQNDIDCTGIGTGAMWLQEFGASLNVEFCFNRIKVSETDDYGISILGNATCGAVWVYRNTVEGHVRAWDLDSSKGPWTYADNVIINDSSETDKITRTNVTDPAQLISTGNLVGVDADGIVDSNGNLTASYTDEIGQKGWQIVESA